MIFIIPDANLIIKRNIIHSTIELGRFIMQAAIRYCGKQVHRHVTWVGFEPRTFVILEQIRSDHIDH